MALCGAGDYRGSLVYKQEYKLWRQMDFDFTVLAFLLSLDDF